MAFDGCAWRSPASCSRQVPFTCSIFPPNRLQRILVKDYTISRQCPLTTASLLAQWTSSDHFPANGILLCQKARLLLQHIDWVFKETWHLRLRLHSMLRRYRENDHLRVATDQTTPACTSLPSRRLLSIRINRFRTSNAPRLRYLHFTAIHRRSWMRVKHKRLSGLRFPHKSCRLRNTIWARRCWTCPNSVAISRGLRLGLRPQDRRLIGTNRTQATLTKV